MPKCNCIVRVLHTCKVKKYIQHEPKCLVICINPLKLFSINNIQKLFCYSETKKTTTKQMAIGQEDIGMLPLKHVINILLVYSGERSKRS